MYNIILTFVVHRSQPPAPPIITTGRTLGGSQFILKAKLTSFLKSPLLKTLELIYHIIFCGLLILTPLAPLIPPKGALVGI